MRRIAVLETVFSHELALDASIKLGDRARSLTSEKGLGF